MFCVPSNVIAPENSYKATDFAWPVCVVPVETVTDPEVVTGAVQISAPVFDDCSITARLVQVNVVPAVVVGFAVQPTPEPPSPLPLTITTWLPAVNVFVAVAAVENAVVCCPVAGVPTIVGAVLVSLFTALDSATLTAVVSVVVLETNGANVRPTSAESPLALATE